MNLQAPEKGSIWTDRHAEGYEIVVLEGWVEDMTDGGKKVVYADPDGRFIRSRTVASFNRVFAPKPKPILTEDLTLRSSLHGHVWAPSGNHGDRQITIRPDGTWTGEWL